jgi:guanyl-specific ribonuclease Sa
MGVIDVLSLVLAVPSLGASRLGASSARAALLALLVHAAATGASVLTVDMARDLGLPSWASTLVAIGVGLTVAVVGGKILIYGPRGQQIGPAINLPTTRVVDPSVGLRVTSPTPRASLPQDVRQIYDQYSQHGWKGNVPGQTPKTRAGGVFKNKNHELPLTDSTGQPLTYKEFDVNNRIPGVKRDTERFVRCDQNKKVYYTNDHYLTLTEVVP